MRRREPNEPNSSLSIDRIAISRRNSGSTSTGGRRAKILNFCRDFGYMTGIDLGATSVDVVTADFCGTALLCHDEALDVCDGAEPILEWIIGCRGVHSRPWRDWRPGRGPLDVFRNADAVWRKVQVLSNVSREGKAQELDLKIYSYPEFMYKQSKNKTRVVIGGSISDIKQHFAFGRRCVTVLTAPSSFHTIDYLGDSSERLANPIHRFSTKVAEMNISFGRIRTL